MGAFWLGMGVLTQKTTIWPNPRDLYMAGSKLFLNFLIQKSSAAIGLSHPLAIRVTPTEDTIRDIVQGKIHGVLKREFSSHNLHVYSQHTKDAQQKFRDAVVQGLQHYSSGETKFQTPLWFIQPYIAPLVYLGEIRAFVVNGVLFKAFVTTPSQEVSHGLEVQEPIIFMPLSKLRYGHMHLFLTY
jgi:hypothetical protein